MIPISGDQAHHARTVLRLEIGDLVQLFDTDGQTATGTIKALEPQMLVEIAKIEQRENNLSIIVASAVPKGDRADWMVEKLSELGVSKWIPLKTARSVVHPDGTSKYQRWQRLATESAKQCKRSGVMQIAELVSLDSFIQYIQPRHTIFLSTTSGPAPLNKVPWQNEVNLLIGPEGGWTEDEEKQMRDRCLTPASLGQTILRVETAAIVSAGIVASSDSIKD